MKSECLEVKALKAYKTQLTKRREHKEELLSRELNTAQDRFAEIFGVHPDGYDWVVKENTFTDWEFIIYRNGIALFLAVNYITSGYSISITTFKPFVVCRKCFGRFVHPKHINELSTYGQLLTERYTCPECERPKPTVKMISAIKLFDFIDKRLGIVKEKKTLYELTLLMDKIEGGQFNAT